MLDEEEEVEDDERANGRSQRREAERERRRKGRKERREEWREKQGREEERENQEDVNNPTNLPRICSNNSTVGCKYFVSAKRESRFITMFIDSGADLSIFPSNLAGNLGLKLIELESPIQVRGFDGKTQTTISHRVELALNFHPGLLNASFYICDAPHPMISH